MTEPLALDRRELIARMALTLGAAALPGEAFAAPARKAARWLPAPRFALMSAIVDTILPKTDTPGALAAGVPVRLDGMLRDWASAKTRADVVATLAKIDDAAKAATKKGFVALTPAQRAEVLTAYDAAALKSVPPPPGAKGMNPFAPSFYVADPGYLRLKQLTVDLFYYSEVGTKSELPYVHVPGKFQPSAKLTPQSRPDLGIGPF